MIFSAFNMTTVSLFRTLGSSLFVLLRSCFGDGFLSSFAFYITMSLLILFWLAAIPIFFILWPFFKRLLTYYRALPVYRDQEPVIEENAH